MSHNWRHSFSFFYIFVSTVQKSFAPDINFQIEMLVLETSLNNHNKWYICRRKVKWLGGIKLSISRSQIQEDVLRKVPVTSRARRVIYLLWFQQCCRRELFHAGGRCSAAAPHIKLRMKAPEERTKSNSLYKGTSVGISKTITTISSLGYRRVRRAGFLGLWGDLSILSQDSSWWWVWSLLK